MNPFYTWDTYFVMLQRWIWHFSRQESLYWPITKESLRANDFWRRVIQSATDLEMLDLYGCLDSDR